MKINKENYSIYFIDYSDGKLDKFQLNELYAFLSIHPELREEFDSLSALKIIPSEKLFPEKEKLKRVHSSRPDIQNLIVAFTEGDLSEAEKLEMEAAMAVDDQLSKEIHAFTKARLVPDNVIVCPDKNGIRKGGKILFISGPAVRRIAVAACVCLIALTFFLLNKKDDRPVFTEEHVLEIKAPIQKNRIEDSSVILSENNKEESEGLKKIPQKSIAIKKSSVVLPAVNPSSLIAEKPDSEFVIVPSVVEAVSEIRTDSILTQQTFKKQIIPQSDLSQIFDKNELEEFAITDNSKKSLKEVAVSGIKKLSEKADIHFDKSDDPANESVNYALAVGNSFSISHTRSK
jgi:hypothetical protein